MRKIGILLLPLIIFGCEQTFDNLIDTVQQNFQVESVRPVDSLAYNPNDSLITIGINFSSESNVKDVFCDIIAPDEKKLNSSPFQLLDNGDSSIGDNTKGDNKFANKYPFSQTFLNGVYNIKYYVKSTDETMQQVAVGKFSYSNGQDNLPPVIENDVIDPDTLVVTEATAIFTSLDASDPNGQNDIEMVWFIVYKPDSTTNGVKIELFDDGDTPNTGDQVAGDGTYSRLIQVDETNDKGTYRFEFQARDRGGKLSNTIDHLVLIQ